MHKKRQPLNYIIINYPHTGLTVNSYFLPTSKSRDTKSRTKIQN